MRRQSTVAVIAWLACGCATAPEPKPEPVEAPAPQTHAPPPKVASVKIAILPVESDVFPAVAEAINKAFKKVVVHTVDEYFRSKATLDVVQLSIECVEATDACFSAVGKSLDVNFLLIAQISPAPKPARGVSVKMTLFNVDIGVPMTSIDRVFKKQEDAVNGIGPLISEVVGERTRAESNP